MTMPAPPPRRSVMDRLLPMIPKAIFAALPLMLGFGALSAMDDAPGGDVTGGAMLRHLAPGAVVIGALSLIYISARRAGLSRETHIRDFQLRQLTQLESVDTMTGQEFEVLVADLLRRDGFTRVTVVGGSGDQGVDVLARSPRGVPVAVQCKRQVKPVGSDRIRNLIGAIHAGHAGRMGILITSSTFTRPAIDEASRHLVLINRERLAAWLDGQPLKL